ncbi:MAG TPA: hypothetical protein VKB86_04970 [Pyrinomonadaceae bacterium]|nr:hypothetical protein [Pyrinomonadaceae bacterium]
MRRRRIVAVGLTLLLSLTSLSFKCGGGGGTTSPDDNVRKAAKACDDIAGALKAMEEAKRDLLTNGKITKEESNQLTKLLLKLVDADRTFCNGVRQAKQFDATNKPNLTTLFASLTSAINELNSSGILNISNADAKNRLSAIIATINAAIAVIGPLLQ